MNSQWSLGEQPVLLTNAPHLVAKREGFYAFARSDKEFGVNPALSAAKRYDSTTMPPEGQPPPFCIEKFAALAFMRQLRFKIVAVCNPAAFEGASASDSSLQFSVR